MTSSDPRGPEPVLPLDWARQTGKVPQIYWALEQKLRRKRRKSLNRAAGAVGVLALLAFSLWAIPEIRDTGTLVTAPSHRQTFSLSDGSVLELNAHTDAQTDFRYGRRRVHLEKGEAFFAVAKDPAHPFFVETPKGTIRVTGTHFDVRLDPEGTAVVTLVEGSVKVTPETEGGAPVMLKPGQQAACGDTGTQVRALSQTEIDNTLSWRSGRLALDGLTLGQAVSRFASYHDKQIRISPEVASLPVGGSCPLDDFPGFLQFMREAFGVHIVTSADGATLIVGR
jgi:transmembrane sensor